MATQADLDALVTESVSSESTLQSEITALQNQSPSLVLSGLQNAVQSVANLASGLAADANAPRPGDQ